MAGDEPDEFRAFARVRADGRRRRLVAHLSAEGCSFSRRLLRAACGGHGRERCGAPGSGVCALGGAEPRQSRHVVCQGMGAVVAVSVPVRQAGEAEVSAHLRGAHRHVAGCAPSHAGFRGQLRRFHSGHASAHQGRRLHGGAAHGGAGASFVQVLRVSGKQLFCALVALRRAGRFLSSGGRGASSGAFGHSGHHARARLRQHRAGPCALRYRLVLLR